MPDRAAAIHWLSSQQVVTAGGEVLSWHNPEHPGFAYPEAGALVLRLFESLDIHRPMTRAIRTWLWSCVEQNEVGKNGHRYTFDLAVVVAALASERADADERLALRHLGDRLITELRTRTAVRPGATARWSTVFGPHLLKAAVALQRLSSFVDIDVDWKALPSVQAEADGRIVTPPGSKTYLHAMLYALEGLAVAVEAGIDPDRNRRSLQSGLNWLRAVQHPGGGLVAHHDGTHGAGPHPADATAQAVRLWALVDRRAHAEAIADSLAFVAELQDPSGGIRYSDASGDLNTWATVFTVQAIDLAREGSGRAVDLL